MQRSRTFRQVAALIALGVAGATLVAGCGDSSARSCCDTEEPASPGVTVASLLTGSVAKTLATGNAKVQWDVVSSAAGQTSSYGGDGIADFAANKFQLTLQLPGPLADFGPIEERVIGNDVYEKGPPIENLPSQKPWEKVDISDISASTTSEFGTTSTSGLDLASEDPGQLLTTLRGVSGAVTKVDTAEVRGVQTTHYRAEVDFAKAVHASGAGAAMLDQFAKTLGISSVPEDVYLDGSGLVRRLSLVDKSAAVPSAVPGSASFNATSMTVTVDFYDFGKADTSGIVAPPASEVGSPPG